jgi:hypothetical protein
VGQVKDGTATPVYERTVVLTAGVETTFETRELSSGSDPVLHLLAPNGIDFMRNDDADSDGTKDARITVRPTVGGIYRLVLHASSQRLQARLGGLSDSLCKWLWLS